MNEPLSTLPRYFQKHFYLGILIILIAVVAKAILWIFEG